jgi:hypothetical protein
MLLLMMLTSHHSCLRGVLPGVLVIGAGLVLTVAPLTSTAMSSAPGEHAGLASAVNNDVARAAGLFAVAVLPVATGLTGSAYLHPAAFSHGFREATMITAILCFAGAAIAAVTISNTSRGQAHSDVMSQNCGCCPTPPLRVPATTDAA